MVERGFGAWWGEGLDFAESEAAGEKGGRSIRAKRYWQGGEGGGGGVGFPSGRSEGEILGDINRRSCGVVVVVCR